MHSSWQRRPAARELPYIPFILGRMGPNPHRAGRMMNIASACSHPASHPWDAP